MIKVIIKNGENIISLSDGSRLEVSDILKNINIEDESFKFFKRIESETVNGKKISELYIYDNIEMYNFNRGTIYEKLKELISKIIMLDEIIKYINISDNCNHEILVITDDSILADLSSNLFQIKDVKLENEIEIKNDKKIISFSKIRISYLFFKRWLKGIHYFIKTKFKDSDNRILLYTQVESINSMKINNKLCYYDSLYGKTIQELKSDCDIFMIQILNFKTMIHKADNLEEKYFPFELVKIWRKLCGKLFISKDKIENHLTNLSLFNYKYKDFDLYTYIDKYVFGDLETIYINYVKEIFVLKRIIKSLNVKKVLVVDEADRPRCAIVAGNMLNIDTFALQHGLINTTSIAYMIPSNQKILIPKNTFLWGEEFKNTLIENTKVYKTEMLKVVGQPRTDYLYEKSKEYKLENNENQINILFATQPIKDLSEDSFNILCKALCNLENYNLIVKMHPGDNNYQFYDETIKKFNLKNYEVTKDKDLYDCLLWCNVIISVHSTVVLEGAILGKPSICILLSKYNDEGNFVKDGLSLGAGNHDELLNILSNMDILKERRYEEFVSKNFYKLDGKVAIRIANVVNNKCEV